MIHQLQPNNWSCLLTSFAMAYDMPVVDLVDLVGHDGSEIMWPHLAPPNNRRGFHIQELIMAGNSMGYTVTPFEPRPVLTSADMLLQGEPKPLDLNRWLERFMAIMAIGIGVLTGQTNTGARHAIACNMGKPFDPSGQITDLDSFQVQCYWRVIKSEFV